jgi:predicted permease
MRSSWLRICRTLAPADLRARVFDPTVNDLDVRRARRLDGHTGALAHLVANVSWLAGVLTAAIQCRLLRRAPAVPASVTHGDSIVVRWSRDARLALRRMRREPAFAAFAVSTLAFGIGANIAVFSFVNAYLVAPLPLPDASRLVRVCGHTQSSPCDVVSYPNYADLRDATPGLDLAAHAVTTIVVGPDDTGESRSLELVTGNYFRALRVTPLLGRLLDARDDVTEMAHPVVVLGEAYWRGREGGRPDIIGKTILLNSASYEVVGVVPAFFHGTQSGSSPDLWAPLMMQQQLRPRKLTLRARGWGWLHLIGRIDDRASLAQVQAALDRTGADLTRRFPSSGDAKTYVATRATMLEEDDRANLVPAASLTMALSGLLLVVTCANLAGLMQARAVARRREVAIRQSLGAARGRVLAEWLTECLAIALIGGAAGLALARLVAIGVAQLPAAALLRAGRLDVPLDWRVLGFAFGTSIVAAFLVGLPTARWATSVGVSDVLKDEGTSTSGGRRGLRLRRATVLVQVAAAAVLLVGSGLLLASLRNLRTFDPGFRPDHLAGASVDLKRAQLSGPAAAAFTQAALDRVRALPGIVSADIVGNVPLTDNRDRIGFQIPGYVAPDGTTIASIDMNVVGARYFSTMGIGFVEGRTWTAGEHAAVVNETMVRHFFPTGGALGASIEVVGEGRVTIAGVVRDSAYYNVGETPVPFVFLPAEVGMPTGYTLIARTSVPPDDALAGITDAIRATNARVRPFEIGTFESWREVQLYPQRLLAWATAAFGAIALGLTAIGLFGVVSTSVALRTREIGIRMALGARPDRVLAGVLRESAALVIVGAAIGLAVAYASAGLLRQWLFGVSRFDATTYLLVVVVLGAMTLMAAGLPARRASRIDPIRALRT